MTFGREQEMPGSIIYSIDADDRIVEVNEEWSRFASANGGNPDPEAVIGRKLWEFIIDEGNRSLYRAMVRCVRNRLAPLQFPFRCDSPTVERHMTMTIAPGNLGEITFVSAQHYSFDRPAQLVGGLRSETARIVECEACHRLWTDRGWRDCWDVIAAGELEIDDRPIRVLHTYCNGCGPDEIKQNRFS